MTSESFSIPLTLRQLRHPGDLFIFPFRFTCQEGVFVSEAPPDRIQRKQQGLRTQAEPQRAGPACSHQRIDQLFPHNYRAISAKQSRGGRPFRRGSLMADRCQSFLIELRKPCPKSDRTVFFNLGTGDSERNRAASIAWIL